MIETILVGGAVAISFFTLGRKKKQPELEAGPKQRWTVVKETSGRDIEVYIQDNNNFTEEREFDWVKAKHKMIKIPKRILIGVISISSNEKPYKIYKEDKYGNMIPEWTSPEDNFEELLSDLIAKAQDKALTLNAYEEVI